VPPGEIDRQINRGNNRLKSCRHGDMIFNVHDQHIGRSLDLYGEWAESELELLALFIKPGDVVVDVGANIGTHAVFFAQRAGATGLVYAFEPQRIIYDDGPSISESFHRMVGITRYQPDQT